MFSFTFRQIEVFLEICRAGNFSSAAERLQVSQPAISNVIRTLETQLDVELFERRRGASSVLSRDGMAFREIAQQFVSQCEVIGRGGRGRQRPRPLRIYVGNHLLEDHVRPLLPTFHEEYPHISLTFLQDRSRGQLLQDIRTGKVDVAVVTSPKDEATPATLMLGDVPAGIWARRDLCSSSVRAEVAKLPFIMPPKGSHLEAQILQELAKIDIVPVRVAGTTQYHDVMIRMACQGKGAIFTLQSMVDSHDERRQLRLAYATEPWERRVYIDPRVEPASATAMASFVTRALSVLPVGVKQRRAGNNR